MPKITECKDWKIESVDACINCANTSILKVKLARDKFGFAIYKFALCEDCFNSFLKNNLDLKFPEKPKKENKKEKYEVVK